MVSGIGGAFFCFGLFIGTVIIRFHCPRLGHRLHTMIRLWILLVPVYVALYFGLHHFMPVWLRCPLPWMSLEGLVAFVNGLLLYWLLFLAWCYCYFCVDHSLSIGYMIALENTVQRRLTLEDLKASFPFDQLLTGRLRDLEANGFVTQENGWYALTAKGRRNATIAGGLKRFLRLEPGG